MNKPLHHSELLTLTTKEHEEWEANGLGFKKNLKQKVKQMKESVKARRGISEQDYRALLMDRARRMKLIQLARPILLDNRKLAAIGASEQTLREFYGEVQNSDELNGGYRAAEEALQALNEAVFTHGLTRDEFRRQASKFSFGMSDLEKGEMCIDWVIWRLKPFLESLALRFGFQSADDLNEVRMRAIVDVVNQGLTYHAPAPGKGGYQWMVTRDEADRMAKAFPNIAHHIMDGITD